MNDSVCKTRLYAIWAGIKRRCLNKNADNYPRYGGRGITICDEWKDNFYSFAEWALSHGYQDPPESEKRKRGNALSIDRIDNDKGYSPENCQWITLRANNKKRGGLGDNFTRMTMRLPHKLNGVIEAEAKRTGVSRNALILSLCSAFVEGGGDNARS